MTKLEQIRRKLLNRVGLELVEVADEDGGVHFWFYAEKNDLPIVDKYLANNGRRFGCEDEYVECPADLKLYRVKEEQNGT